jgi:uncharacterized RDD family membrane protein YckC
MTEHASPLPRQARPYQGRRAGVVTRLAGSAIDAVVVLAVLVAGYLGYAGLLFLLDPRRFTFPDTTLILGLAAGFAVLVVYLTAAWTISGRTYGSLVMGLRVVNRRGEKLHVLGAFVRALACAALPVGLLWCAVNPQNRSLQDVLLRTSVVYDWQPTRGRPRPAAGPADEAATGAVTRLEARTGRPDGQEQAAADESPSSDRVVHLAQQRRDLRRRTRG